MLSEELPIREKSEYEARALAAFHAKWLGVDNLEGVQIQDRRGARCDRLKKRGEVYYRIVLPRWPLEIAGCHPAFTTHLIIHECCHLREMNHGAAFKALEAIELGRWGLRVEYARAYATDVYHLGEWVCGPFGGPSPKTFEIGEVVAFNSVLDDAYTSPLLGVVRRRNPLTLSLDVISSLAAVESDGTVRVAPLLCHRMGEHRDLPARANYRSPLVF